MPMTITRAKTLSAAALLLTAGAASAQIAANGITIVVDDDTLRPGESTTIRMEAYFDDAADYAVAQVITDLLSSGGGQGLSDPRMLRPPWLGMPGVVGPEGVLGINCGQVNSPTAEIYADPSNPIAFWEVTYTAPADVAAPFDLSLTTMTEDFCVFPVRSSSLCQSRLGDFAEGEATIRVVPAPAGVVVLGGLLMCARRRR